MRILATVLLLLGLIFAAQGQVGQVLRPGMLFPGVAGCSADTTLQARMDGGQNAAAVTTLICGLVTDGTYTLMDGLWVFATNSETNAQLNWKSSSFNLTKNGTITFAANQGYTGNGTTGFFQTGYTTSSSGQITLNNEGHGSCIVNSRSSNSTIATFGNTSNGTTFIGSVGLNTTHNEESNAGNSTYTQSNAQGSWIVSRTVSTNVNMSKNGATFSPSAITSVSIPTNELYLLARNNSGSAAVWSTDQIAYIFIGGAMGQTQATNTYNRLHTYLQAVGETTAC